MTPKADSRVLIENGDSSGSGSGGERGYYVEARNTYVDPKEICGQLFDKEWRRVHFAKGPVGIPGSKFPNFAFSILSLFTYSQAEALRWWFHANADVDFDALCLETRLVEVEVKYNYSSQRTAYVGEVDFHGPKQKTTAAA